MGYAVTEWQLCGDIQMIYRERMTLHNDYVYNFRIFKVANTLWKLQVISMDSLLDHISVMEDGRAAGLMIDYTNYTLQGGVDVYYQF